MNRAHNKAFLMITLERFALGTLIVAFISLTSSAYAELPTGMQTISGTATFQSDGSTLNINASNKAIINYQTFNIGSGNTVNIYSPLSLNRVVGGNPSSILGNLNSTGKVFLINPSGIIFGQGSQVNVQGLVASTLQIKNDDFLAGKYSFQTTSGLPAGSILNHGHLNASDSIAMLGGAVTNTGSIQAPQVRLAVGDQITYFASPEVGIDLVVGDSLKQKVDNTQSAILNTGSIQGQDISLQAKLAQAFYETTVNNSGIIRAQGLSLDKTGKVSIVAATDDNQALVYNTGLIAADGSAQSINGGQIHFEGDTAINAGTLSVQSSSNGIGGSIAMLGNAVQNSGNALLNASGDLGGGSILVGGDYQGSNSAIRNALYNISTSNAKFLANATNSGNGGKVILWANDKTIFQGSIEAKGGLLSGNGGFVETSGKNILQALGTVSSNAYNGQNGQWLLDPNNISIRNAAPEQFLNISGTSPLLITSADDNAIVTSGTIENALNNGTNVTIKTSNVGTNSEMGDITIWSGTTISKTAGGDATLNLLAHRSINFTGGNGANLIQVLSSGNGNKLNLVLNADTDQGSDGGIGGGIALDGVNISTNGGNLIMGGGTDPTTQSAIGTNINTNINGIEIGNSTINTQAGNIIMNGKGNSDPTQDGRTGVHLSQGSVVQTTSGNITVNGDSGTNVNRNYGIYVEGNAIDSQIKTQDGTITLNGTGRGTGFDARGIVIDRTGKVISTGNGNVVINANSQGIGTTGNMGLYMDGNGFSNDLTGITTVNGNISITANGATNATTDSNRGLFMVNGVQIASSGTGSVNITAHGGGGTNNNTGLYMDGYNNTATDIALISTNSGNLTVNATGGNGSQWNNHGVQINHGAAIKSTGSGTVSVTGTGGVASGNDNYGVYINANNNAAQQTGIFSNSGNLTVTGQGGSGASDSNHGLYVEQGGQIYSGSGNSSLVGIKGTGNNAHSIYTNNGSNILGSNSQSGNLSLAADDFTLNNVQLRSSGKVIFAPHTNTLSMGLNGGAGSLSLGNTQINLIDTSTVTPSAIVFGNSSSANNTVTIGNNWNLSGYNMPLEVYGGNITTGSIDMGSKSLLMQALTGNLTINNGSILTSTANGNAIVLAANSNFINNAASNTALSTSNGRWLVYSSDPANTTEGFSSYTKRYNRTFSLTPPSSVTETGNVFLYSIAPTITITADNASRAGGVSNPTFTGSLSAGLIDGDTNSDAYTGTPAFTSAANINSNAGTYAINLVNGSITSPLGYQLVYNPGTLTVTSNPTNNIFSNTTSQQQIPFLLSPTQTPTTVLPNDIQTRQVLQSVPKLPQNDSSGDLSPEPPLVKVENIPKGSKHSEWSKDDAPKPLLPEGLFPELLAKHDIIQ